MAATARIIPPKFGCNWPIGSYVKLSSAVGAIMFEGPNRRTHFWKITIQWLFHQNFGGPALWPRWLHSCT
jgi:hypothetical protein